MAARIIGYVLRTNEKGMDNLLGFFVCIGLFPTHEHRESPEKIKKSEVSDRVRH